MNDDLFLITGGGTGAKVAEAFIHLCAAGLGPKHVHILMIDADTVNGNLKRALATGQSYRQLQRWPWTIRTSFGGFLGFGQKEVNLQLFSSDIKVYDLASPIEATHAGGIRNSVSSDGMRQVLDLLYDADEQKAKCDDGFRARPNLGCLLLADHINKRLPADGGAFLDALIASMSAGSPIPVVVAASVFGGTGASLLPVIRGCVEQAVKARRGKEVEPGLLRWGAVKVLPHYRPDKTKATVDPDRYLLDTASALQYYSTVQRTANAAYNAVYVIGSDKPSRNKVKAVLGQAEQSNPAYFEEYVCALAVQHFGETLETPGKPIRLFDPAHGETLKWEHLPHLRPYEVQQRFAYLLHLAAFYLRQQSNPSNPELAQGLASLLRTTSPDHIFAHPWYKNVLDAWASHDPRYAGTPREQRPLALIDQSRFGEQSVGFTQAHVTDYFCRLMLWSDSAFKGDALSLIDNVNSDDYCALFGAMCKVKSDDVDTHQGQRIQDEQDNALIRLLRSAATALVLEHERTRKSSGRTHGTLSLIEPDGRIGPRITLDQVRKALQAERLSDVDNQYIGTRISS
jgi:hypothetical protein